MGDPIFQAKLTQQQIELVLGQQGKRLTALEQKSNQHSARLTGVETNIVYLGNRVTDALRQIDDFLQNNGGGGSGYVPGPEIQEVLNAVAGVDAPDGLRLDKRLDDLYSGILDVGTRVSQVEGVKDKTLIIPRSYNLPSLSDTLYQLPPPQYGEYVAGVAAVLNETGDSPLIINGELVTAVVSATGQVAFSMIPVQPSTLVYSLRVTLGELPEDFLQLVNRGNDTVAADLAGIQSQLEANTQAIELEQITPKGLTVTSSGSTVYVSFSYEDSPELSHFILERYDPATGRWVPYDGASGIVPK